MTVKYVVYKAALALVLIGYVLWLYNQLRYVHPELRTGDNGLSIFWAAVFLFVVGICLVVRNDNWIVIAFCAVLGTIFFQKFWELKSSDSLHITILGLITVVLFVAVLPVDRMLIEQYRERRGKSPVQGRPKTPSDISVVSDQH